MRYINGLFEEYFLTEIIIALIIILFFFLLLKFYKKRSDSKENYFKKLFEINPFPLVLTSLTDGRVIAANNRALEFYEVSEEELPHFNAADFYISSEERRAIITGLMKTGYVKNHIIQQKAGNDYKWVLLNYQIIEEENETYILTGLIDVTDFKKIEAELEKRASTDTLTGIHNRRKGLELLTAEIAKAKSTHRPFVICFIDVDNLKIVNDPFGHAEGDYLIKRICEIIEGCISQRDVFFRYGGDEFVIVFTEKNKEAVEGVWKQILQRLSEDKLLNNKKYSISMSHGLYEYNSKEDLSIEEMIGCADQEMYREKIDLKKSVQLF